MTAARPTIHDVAARALQIHGALGVSNEMPFSRMLVGANVLQVFRVYDVAEQRASNTVTVTVGG